MILIIDFGSQFTQLIARRIRSLHRYCEIISCFDSHLLEKVQKSSGIVLSGGPASVYEEGSPQINALIFDLGKPILAICYGFQLIAKHFGGEVRRSSKREFGVQQASFKYEGVAGTIRNVLMSHSDKIDRLPDDFDIICSTENCAVAGAVHRNRKILGLQFHPEVTNTDCGAEIIQHWLQMCDLDESWTASNYVQSQIETIRSKVGNDQVLCALSGGVDSCVTAALIHRAIPNQIFCVFVDNGLLRQDERQEVQAIFYKMFGTQLITIDATDRFLDKLKGVVDPEQKRKVIGRAFIDEFTTAIEDHNLKKCRFLAQGTLYPDVIESTNFKGPSSLIKSHHNVGGLPENLQFELLEPLRMLFKDEVRLVGKSLGIDDRIINRQPFPGPGLAVRISGEVTSDKLSILRQADAIVREETSKDQSLEKIWQGFATLLPIKTVGVMGDGRTYNYMCGIRIVDSEDGMTATVPYPVDTLKRISHRIVQEVVGINRVMYDITSKPPATIEIE